MIYDVVIVDASPSRPSADYDLATAEAQVLIVDKAGISGENLADHDCDQFCWVRFPVKSRKIRR